jgi:hypothetical protein
MSLFSKYAYIGVKSIFIGLHTNETKTKHKTSIGVLKLPESNVMKPSEVGYAIPVTD